MTKIGGNTRAVVQVRDSGTKNQIGERIHQWVDVAALTGWLDLIDGGGSATKRTVYNAAIQESSHIFLCDFQSFKNLSSGWVWNPFNLHTGVISNAELPQAVDATSENARIVIDNQIFNIMLIDDPMNMHQHLEIYLKFTGGQ